MIDIARIFQDRVPNHSRLQAFGFQEKKGEYVYTAEVLEGTFTLEVIILKENRVHVKVWDRETENEYVMVHIPAAEGSFVGEVIQVCEERLNEIAKTCFDEEIFASRQAQQVIAYIAKTYQDQLEFLWEKMPDYAVFRRSDSQKWYAILLKVPPQKLGLEGEGKIEILDLRGCPEKIVAEVDGKRYFPGYHMNKKHWYTIDLNGAVTTEEIFQRIDISYALAK